MRMGVIGVGGRMGRLLVEEIAAAGHVVAGGTLGGRSAAPAGVAVLRDVAALAGVSDVVIDFTVAQTAAGHAAALGALGVPWVLGTSGLSAADEAAVAGGGRADRGGVFGEFLAGGDGAAGAGGADGGGVWGGFV